MKLVEAAGAEVYRAFGVPLKNIWSMSTTDLHDRNYKNGYGGIWVGLTPQYPDSYGRDLGTTPTLMLPVMCSFAIDPQVKSRAPMKHPGDDDEIPGMTMKLEPNQLGEITGAYMLVAGAWTHFNPTNLQQLLKNRRVLDSLLQTQEVDMRPCKDLNCASHAGTVGSVDDLDGLCDDCVSELGLTDLV